MRLVVVVVITAICYLHTQGFPGFLRLFIETQLLRAGVAAKFAEIRIDLWRGIVAEDAVLADAKDPDRPLAQINEVALQLNWGRLLRGKSVVGGLKIANAKVAVPTPSDEIGSEFFTAEEAYATLRFEDDGTISIEQLIGVYCGIDLNIVGSVKPRAASGQQPVSPAARAGQFVFITKTLRELSRIQVHQPPKLDLDFNLDLADPMATRLRASLRGNQIGYRDISVDDMQVRLTIDKGALDITQFKLGLYNGEILFTGRYDFANGTFDLKLKSSTDPTAFAVVLPPGPAAALRKLAVAQNPEFRIRYYLSEETGILPRLEGWVDAKPFKYQGIQFNEVQAAISMTHPVLTLSDVHVVMPEGELKGHGRFHLESTDFDYELDSTLNPSRLLPLMPPNVKRIVEPARFKDSPHLVAKVRGDFVDPDNFAYEATLSVDDLRYRGVPMVHASARLRLRESRLDVREMVVRRDDGELRGRLLADFNRERTAFDIAGTANPVPMAALLGPKAAAFASQYHVDGPFRGQAVGVADFADPLGTTWSAEVSAGYFSHQKTSICNGEGSLVFTNNTLSLRAHAGSGSWDQIATRAVRYEGVIGPKGGVLQVEGQDWAWRNMAAGDGAVSLRIIGNEVDGFGHFDRATWGGMTADKVDVDFRSEPSISLVSLDAAGCKVWILEGAKVSTDLVIKPNQMVAAMVVDDLKWWKVRSDLARADVIYADDTMFIDNFQADFYGGRLDGGVAMQFNGGDLRYRLQFRAREGDIGRYAERILDRNTDMTGKFAGHLSLEGAGSNMESVNGSGSLAVNDAMLLDLPFLGIFSRLLNNIWSGLGSIKVTSASADFQVESGVAKTENLTMRAGAFTLTSRGQVDPDGALDFYVKAELLRQVPGLNLLGWMLGKMFEYKVGGTLSNPTYRPIRLPKEIMPHSQ
jgi:hypothetical protein